MEKEGERIGELSFGNVVVPLAGEEDAAITCEALRPHLETAVAVTVVHVVEKAGGGIDPTPVGHRKRRGRRIFEYCERELDPHVGSVSGEINYHTDVVRGILEIADRVGADAIVFTPRGESRLLKLLTGDTAFGLIHRSDRPVVVVPGPESIE